MIDLEQDHWASGRETECVLKEKPVRDCRRGRVEEIARVVGYLWE